jgi:hypothetical protein
VQFTREFLHFLLISAGMPHARQAIETAPFFDFLQLLHFLQPLPLNRTPSEA